MALVVSGILEFGGKLYFNTTSGAFDQYKTIDLINVTITSSNGTQLVNNSEGLEIHGTYDKSNNIPSIIFDMTFTLYLAILVILYEIWNYCKPAEIVPINIINDEEFQELFNGTRHRVGNDEISYETVDNSYATRVRVNNYTRVRPIAEIYDLNKNSDKEIFIQILKKDFVLKGIVNKHSGKT